MAATSQKYADSWPIFLRYSAAASALPPKIACAIAYGTATPTARTCAGYSSALKIALSPEYPDSSVSGTSAQEAVAGSVAVESASRTGGRWTSASVPNDASNVRRCPTIGHPAGQRRQQHEHGQQDRHSWDTSGLSNPALFTSNFCM